MNKRKLDINELKKKSIKGRKYGSMSIKYESVRPFFKQKEDEDQQSFQINFIPLINDLIDEINALQIAYKVQNNIESLKHVLETEKCLQLDSFSLKVISSEYPIRQICQCIMIKENEKNQLCLQINKNKKNNFQKNMRKIYPQFCVCIGQKCVLQSVQLKNIYEIFKVEWNKLEEKGKQSQLEKLEKKICRSLFFIGIVIENNIFYEINKRQQKKKEELADLGTKSEKKKNKINDVKFQVSSTYSCFGSADIFSNFSQTLKSQKSNEQDLNIKYDHSQKSQRIVSRFRHNLFAKAQIKTLKMIIYPNRNDLLQSQDQQQQNQRRKYSHLNLLTNETQNRIIKRAFQKQLLYEAQQQNSSFRMIYPPSPYLYHFYQVSGPNTTISNTGNIQRHNFVSTIKTPKNIRPPTGKIGQTDLKQSSKRL